MTERELEAALADEPEDELVRLVAIRAVGIPRSHTPGGVGFVELGLTGALVAFGAGNAEAVAVTLIHRFLTTIPTIVLGLLAASTWYVGHRPRQVSTSGP